MLVYLGRDYLAVYRALAKVAIYYVVFIRKYVGIFRIKLNTIEIFFKRRSRTKLPMR